MMYVLKYQGNENPNLYYLDQKIASSCFVLFFYPSKLHQHKIDYGANQKYEKQVDKNIGGRQDQRKNSLWTKTLIFGLFMAVGGFAVGYFSATATLTATATLVCHHPTVILPFIKFFSIHYSQSHSPKIRASPIFKHNL